MRPAGRRAGCVLDADVDNFFPLAPNRIFVGDKYFEIGARVINSIWVQALLDQGITIFVGKGGTLDAVPLEPRLSLIDVEVDEMSVLDRLLIRIEECWSLIATVKNTERISVEECRGCCGEADHTSVEILDNLGEAIEYRAMGFVEDDQIEEGRRKLLIANSHSLKCRHV